MIEKLLAFLQSLFLIPSFRESFSRSNDSKKDVEITPENALEIFNELLAAQSTNKTNQSVSHIIPIQRTEPIVVSKEAHPISLLKKLAPLRFLSDSVLEQLDHSTLHYTAESVAFLVGERTDYAYYLLQGSIEMRPDGVFPYTVSFDTPQALMPLNTGHLCGATGITITPSIILAVSRTFLSRLSQQKYRYTAGAEFVKSGLPRQLPNNQFFHNFATVYRENTLSLPGLPVALRLKKALEERDVSIEEATNIIQFDATIVAKLIQMANSVFYAAEVPITNCQKAVMRLGLDTTRRVVMGMSVKQLFNCQNEQLKALMNTTWRESIYLSSLCFILARESKNVNPEDALLAGLICDIGKIPVLNFAEQQETILDMMELKIALPFLSPPVGTLMLHNLDFPAELVNIPRFAEDWFYESGEEKLTLIDIVILAKLHSYFGSKKAKYLPFLNTIPAYVKLNEGRLNGDFSLNVLHKAKERVNEAMTFFS